MQKQNVGIVGLGVSLPPTVRTNDWWPREVTDGWQRRRDENAMRAGVAAEATTKERAQTLAAMAEWGHDPFQGAVERRVVAPGVTAAELEAEAGRAAIADAGLTPDDIDFVISYSMLIDDVQVPSACLVHEQLGLPKRCFALEVDTICNSFQTHLSVAEKMLKGGAGRHGLLVQSSTFSRACLRDDPISTMMGDGATAQVVGFVGDGHGVLGAAHFTDATLKDALVCGVPGKPWYEDGRVRCYPKNPRAAREMVMSLCETALEAVPAALDAAGVRPDEVAFYASHQPNRWFRPVTQRAVGLDHARSIDTFHWAGSIGAANIPLCLDVGRKERALQPGDVVVTFAGGTGMTWSSTVMRWGRG